MKVRELLSESNKWTKGWFAKDKNGENTSEECPNAVSFCLSGAIFKCYQGKEMAQVRNKVLEKIQTEIPTWNDSPERTFEEVKALIDELDI